LIDNYILESKIGLTKDEQYFSLLMDLNLANGYLLYHFKIVNVFAH